MKRQTAIAGLAAVVTAACSRPIPGGPFAATPTQQIKMHPDPACAPSAKLMETKAGYTFVQYYDCNGSGIGRARAVSKVNAWGTTVYGLSIYIPGVMERTLWFDAAWKAGTPVSLGRNLVLKPIPNGAALLQNGVVLLKMVYVPSTGKFKVVQPNRTDTISPTETSDKCKADWWGFVSACGAFVVAGLVAIAGAETIIATIGGIIAAGGAGAAAIAAAYSIKEDCR